MKAILFKTTTPIEKFLCEKLIEEIKPVGKREFGYDLNHFQMLVLKYPVSLDTDAMN